MVDKSYSGFLSHVSLFAKNLPGSASLYAMLVLLGLASGIITSYVAHIADPLYSIQYIIASGAIGGIFAIILPTTITIILFKAMRSYIRFKYIIFVSLLAELMYGIFLIFSGAIYYISHSYALALAAIIVSDASIFAWWVFINKIMMNRSKNASMFALLQPTVNLIFFLPASTIFFGVTVPFDILMIKLYAAIFVFLLISYTIIYFIDSPIKKSLGFSGIDTFSQMMQNWLFSINITIPNRKVRNPFGEKADIGVDSVIAMDKSGRTKSMLVVPNIHFGPVGTLGSSNFPYLIERHITSRYKSQSVVLHSAINEDHNAVSSDQFQQLKRAIDDMVNRAKSAKRKKLMYSYCYGESNGARVRLIKFGDTAIATLSRAPRVTEDITPEASVLLRHALQQQAKNIILVDAHNSRYTSASAEELAAVKFDSQILNDYMGAIKSIATVSESSAIKVGTASANLYEKLGRPQDMAPGNVNVVVFEIGAKRVGIIQFNANNINPQFRDKILSHISDKFGVDFELYTTDTHYVNSLRQTASNVLGSTVSYSRMSKALDEAIDSAIKDLKEANLVWESAIMKNFYIWGINQREKMMAAVSSMAATAKVLVPAIIAVGFLIAAWIISLI
jgi:predicted neutral ceramidase superfamily lipid hydrolase